MARTAEELEVSQWDIYYLLDCMSVRKKKILKKWLHLIQMMMTVLRTTPRTFLWDGMEKYSNIDKCTA